MQLIEKENEQSSNKTDMLRNMPISSSKAMDVTAEDVPVVRSLISKLHGTGQYRFTTKKSPTGINVWREK